MKTAKLKTKSCEKLEAVKYMAQGLFRNVGRENTMHVQIAPKLPMIHISPSRT